MKIKLSMITVADLQARAGTDPATVQDYAERMHAGETFPPVTVFHDGEKYFLADGFHRFSACQQNGCKVIEADVRPGGHKDALWHAVGANKAHGLKRSNADKRRAVSLALAEHPEMSDRAIATHVGVNHNLVGDIRGQVALKSVPPSSQVRENAPEKPNEIPSQVALVPPENAEVPANQGKHFSEPSTRTGLDGKQYPVRRDYGPPPVPPPAPSAKPAEPTKVVVKDKVERTIPECCLGLWNRSQEVQDQLTVLSRIKGNMRRAQDEQDTLYALLNFSSILPHLEQAWTELKTALPHAVCPACQGHETTRATCRLCRARGMISEYHWDRFVPQETKNIIAASLKKAEG
jgi:hypothetical protein